MITTRRILLSMAFVACLLSPSITAKVSSSEVITSAAALNQAIAQGLNPKAAHHALQAFKKAKRAGVSQSDIFTIIDYTQPSSRKRLWVLDLQQQKVLYHTYVTHADRSGFDVAKKFSNKPGSHKTSLGMYLTKNPYVGKWGYSMRMQGLEPGINNNALKRAIVMHGAHYANPALITKYGRLGRSWGCPTLPPTLTKPIIRTIKGGSLLFMYANDSRYLSRSNYIA